MSRPIEFLEDRQIMNEREPTPAGTVRDDFSDVFAAAFVANGVAKYVDADKGRAAKKAADSPPASEPAEEVKTNV